MTQSLKLNAKDKGLLFLVLALFIFLVLSASFFFPDIYLIIAFNAIFLFSLFFYLMLFLHKQDLGKARKPKHFPSVTVVIPVFNSKNTIVQCIDSIKKINYPKKVSIVAVDDASTDGSRELLEKINGIELIKLPKNSGKAAALNSALQKVKTDFVVCIDSDSYPEENVLMKSMGYFEDEKVAAVTCLVLPDKRDTFVRKIQFLEYAISFGLNNTLLSSIDSSYVVPGPFTIFRKSVFEKVGYYEAGNLAEDMEFGLRLKDHSLKIINCYDAVVYTDVPHDWFGLFIQRNRWCRGGVFNFIRYKKLLFNKKNPDFGFFVMPFVFASQVLIVAVLARMLLFFVHDLFVFFSVSFNYFSLGGPVFVDLSRFALPSSFLFFLISYIFVGIYFWVCFKSINYAPNRRDFFPLLILIFIYPYFITFTYSQGYFKEMIGVRGSWRRVST